MARTATKKKTTAKTTKKKTVKKPVKKASVKTKSKVTSKKKAPAKKAPAKSVKKKPSKASVKSLSTKKMPRLRTSMMAQTVGLSSSELPSNVQALIDKEYIKDIIIRLARGLDRIDETLLRSAFHHESTLDFGPGIFQGTSNDYIHWAIDVMNQVRSSQHLITNVQTTLEDDTAFTESYCQAHFRMDKPTGREDIFIGSRYLDRFERHPSGASGVWKIMHRKQIIDWVRTEAVSDIFYHKNPDALWSFRSKTDPSYQMSTFPGSKNDSKVPSFLGQSYNSKSIKF